MPVSCAAEPADPLQFLRVAAQGASLATHQDLWRWLRGEVQALLPHELFLAAWGDFRAGMVQVDLVSSLPGLRTGQARAARWLPLAHYLRDCWVAAQHAPCQVDVHGCAGLCAPPGSGAAAVAPDPALGCLRTAVVHGTREAVPAGERVFAALTWRARADEAQPRALQLLVPFIDTALRRMPPLAQAARLYAQAALSPSAASNASTASSLCGLPAARHPLAALVPPPGVLSDRERQIMAWVAMGKTNPEIGCILHISEFTVKNHMKSIFSKLDVSNRAQAVAKLTRPTAHA
jgi:transcriptional regulator EpsA